MKYEVEIPEGKQVDGVRSSGKEILIKLSNKVTDQHACQRIMVEVSNNGNDWYLRKLLAVVGGHHPYRVLDECGSTMSSYRLARIPETSETALDENGIDMTKYRRLSKDEGVIKGDYRLDNRNGSLELSLNWSSLGGRQSENFTYYRPITKGWRPATEGDVGMRCRVKDFNDAGWHEDIDLVFGGFFEGIPFRTCREHGGIYSSWNFCEVFEE